MSVRTAAAARALVFALGCGATTAVWIVAAGSPALAQNCESGRVAVGDGCCWPGQSFDESLGQCVGAPSCPDGTIAVDAACVRSTPALEREDALVHRHDPVLLTLGAVLFFLAYPAAVLTAYATEVCCDVVSSSWLSWIPFAHPAASILDGSREGLVGEAVLTAVEIVGVVLFSLGARRQLVTSPDVRLGALGPEVRF